MMRRRTLVLGFALLAPLVATATAKESITLEQTAGRGKRLTFTSQLKTFSFDADGMLKPDRGDDDAKRIDPKTLAEVPAKSADAAKPDTPAKPDTAEKARLSDDEAIAAIAGLTDMGPENAKKLVESATKSIDGARTRLIFAKGGLYLARESSAKVLLQPGDAAPELITRPGNGDLVVFVRSNDLYGVNLVDGTLTRFSTNGSPSQLNGKLDWVYQEEVYGRGDFKGYFASPDGAHVAFLSLDESPVRDFAIVDPIVSGHFRGDLDLMKYPKAGDPNPTVALRIANASTGEARTIDLGAYEKDEPIVAAVAFTPDSRLCLAVIQDRRQSYADLLAIDPVTGAWKQWIHEQSESWVDRPEMPRWLADGSFLWQSQRTGYNHVYRYAKDGELMNAVTTGEWSVASIAAVDEARAAEGAKATGELWFIGKKESAIDRDLYRCRLDGTDLARLTTDRGTHSIEISPDRNYFLDQFSSLTSPPVCRLCDRDGKVLLVLDAAKVDDGAILATWELLSVPARDGFLLDVAIQKPAGFTETDRYPLWISTYSGPDMPTLANRWSASSWNQFLAQNGVVVMQINVRTAAGIGNAVSGKCHGRLGIQELADIEDAIDFVVRERSIDPRRVGITGYSYGGFMTAFALTHSDKFALGIAGGGVYDWRMYDTIYTERYMDLPSRNAEGYAASSVLAAAKDLKGHLLFHHGVNDDNVHFQNAIQLAYALQKADKSFEFMPYPESGHGIGDRDQNWHFRQLEWNLIQRYLVNVRTL